MITQYANDAEVVGSNPARSIFINLVNCGIKMGLFQKDVGQISLPMPIVLSVIHPDTIHGNAEAETNDMGM